MNVLLLNIDYTPLRIIPWTRAMEGIVSDKLEIVEVYPDKVIRSQSQEWPWPAVIRNKSRFLNQKIRLTKVALYARDGHTCQYCGKIPMRGQKIDKSELSIDHVIPRAKSIGGRVQDQNKSWVLLNSWENLVTACKRCNGLKSDGDMMKPIKLPKAPNPKEIGKMIHVLHPGHPHIWNSWLML